MTTQITIHETVNGHAIHSRYDWAAGRPRVYFISFMAGEYKALDEARVAALRDDLVDYADAPGR